MLNLLRKITPPFLINWYHFLLSALGAFLYRFPSRKLTVVGVTGTNGKSTVVEMIVKILEEAGFKVASLSSINFKIGNKTWPNLLKITMPGRFQIQKFLREALDAHCQYVVLEVTSEGIKQHRQRFIDFDVAVFTNLTPEHIEAHGSFEKYRQAKGKLFQATKNLHIINIDDENSEYFLKFPSYQKFCYSTNENLNIKKLKIDCKLKIENCEFIKATSMKVFDKGTEFTVDNIKFRLKLLGGFNVYNALSAICVGLSQGIDLKTGKESLETIQKIPGRMELVIERPFKVFVDYAFTPNALEKVYQTIENWKLKIENSRMICVLGAAGGGRDKWKRPVLGKIAAKYCDEIIITNEDPYDENPHQILSQIKSGISNVKFQMSNFYEILDRREALKKALSLAKPNDIVVITGKGCEPWICVARGKKIPWDDRKIVREEFQKIYEI